MSNYTVDLLGSSVATRTESCLWVQTREELSIATHQLTIWVIYCCTNSTMCFPTCTAVLEHSVASPVAFTTKEGLQVEETHATDHLQVSETTCCYIESVLNFSYHYKGDNRHRYMYSCQQKRRKTV